MEIVIYMAVFWIVVSPVVTVIVLLANKKLYKYYIKYKITFYMINLGSAIFLGGGILSYMEEIKLDLNENLSALLFFLGMVLWFVIMYIFSGYYEIIGEYNKLKEEYSNKNIDYRFEKTRADLYCCKEEKFNNKSELIHKEYASLLGFSFWKYILENRSIVNENKSMIDEVFNVNDLRMKDINAIFNIRNIDDINKMTKKMTEIDKIIGKEWFAVDYLSKKEIEDDAFYEKIINDIRFIKIERGIK